MLEEALPWGVQCSQLQPHAPALSLFLLPPSLTPLTPPPHTPRSLCANSRTSHEGFLPDVI